MLFLRYNVTFACLLFASVWFGIFARYNCLQNRDTTSSSKQNTNSNAQPELGWLDHFLVRGSTRYVATTKWFSRSTQYLADNTIVSPAVLCSRS
ncbi:hypothetical protein F4604DRAFT_920799 [Suillus subluteus]|nr:hypothetical protein F4604DRAFT_920799 [Suillus subluteus]